MKYFVNRRHVLTAAGASALGVPSVAMAQEWTPNKTIRIIVPIVGSTNDVLARMVAPELQKVLGQSVIVENKGGAGGTIGTTEVVKSAPDGHTLLVGFNGPIAVNISLFDKLPYDPVRDLAPITWAVAAPQFLVVHPSVQARNLAEFVRLVKSRPKQMSYGSVSIGSNSHLTMEMFKDAAGIDIAHIPYRGAAPAVTDLVAGQVQAAFMVPGNVQQFVRDGRLRALAVTGERRLVSSPDVPTMIEQGFPGFVAVSWIGFLAPSATPRPAIDRLNREIVKILRSPEIDARLKQMEFDVIASSPQQFSDWIQSEIRRWGKVIKDHDIKPE